MQFTRNREILFTIGVHLLQQGPWKDFGFRNVVPGGAAGAAPVQFRPGGRRSSPGRDWGRAYELLGSSLGYWVGVERPRRAARRRTGSVATAAAQNDGVPAGSGNGR
jgi:hypothetical protein